MWDMPRLADLSNQALLASLKLLVAQERESTVDVLKHLAEVDRRRAHEEKAYPSLFVYCVRVLGYAEGAAYRRIRAARCASEYPRIYVLLKRGRISLTTISLLAPHMCRENHKQLLEQASGKSRHEVERMAASLKPEPEKRESIRHLGLVAASRHSRHMDNLEQSEPQRELLGSAQQRLSEMPPSNITAPTMMHTDGEQRAGRPDANGEQNCRFSDSAHSRRVQFRFTADESFLTKIRRLREILWHKYPTGRLEDILDEAVETLLEKRAPERRLARLAQRSRPN